MNTVKELNLNRIPSLAKNGSIICAKNIAIDDLGAYFTNDTGIDVAFQCQDEGEYIVGCIPCNKELVIFTYSETTKLSKIYRLDSFGTAKYIKTNWKYSGGIINGNYTYNYKKELIISVAEYPDGDEGMIPLKSFNLDNVDMNLDYNIEEDIPRFFPKICYVNGGNLVAGSYTFYIRYTNDNSNYTKWFPISGKIILIDEHKTEEISHTYIRKDFTETDHTSADGLLCNRNVTSTTSIKISISHTNDVKTFKYFELGYIFEHNTDTVGRIYNKFQINYGNVTDILISNNNYINEESIDNFLEIINQFYNVRNIINYNNRTYISNYITNNNSSKNDVLKKIASEIEISYSKIRQDNFLISNSVLRPSNEVDIDIVNNISLIAKTSLKIYSELYAGTEETSDKSILFSYDTNKLTEEKEKTNITFEQFIDNLFVSYIHDDIKTQHTDYIQIYKKDNLQNITNLDIYVNKYDYYIKINDEFFSIKDFICKFKKSYTIEYHDDDFESYVEGVTSFNVSIDYDNTNEDSDGENDNVDIKEPENEEVVEKNGLYKPICKTCIPYDKYNYFIHFLRKDMSYTNGYHIKESVVPFAHRDSSLSYYSIYPNFSLKSNSDFPEEFIGYFFTYEKIEKRVHVVTCINNTNDTIWLTSSEFIYGLENISGSKIRSILDDENYNTYDIKSLNIVRKTTNQFYIEITIAENVDFIIGNQYLLILNNIEYNKKEKTLYRLSDNYYDKLVTDKKIELNNFYLPGYVTNERFYTYSQECIISASASSVINKKGQTITYKINPVAKSTYSYYPLHAMSIKENLEKQTVNITNKNGTPLGVFYNVVLSPAKAPELLELISSYMTDHYSKYVYVEDDNYINNFDKTIYRSDVISDESILNGFKHYELDNYKNIFENKGSIVNIIGIGLIFIVHTQYSIFIFDRNPKLNLKIQTDIPDTFDLTYQELLPSSNGYGGLEDKHHSIITKNGYIWLDVRNKIIFRYDEGKISILSASINNLLKDLDVYTCMFAEDVINNRLFICLYTSDGSINLSYNFNTNSFISIHDFEFTHSWSTYENTYLFNETNPTKLYKLSKNTIGYGDLTKTTDFYFPIYVQEDKNKSYIDFIFNEGFEISKTLESISYILSEVNNNFSIYNPAEVELNRDYSGEELIIYTDQVNSGLLKINIDSRNANNEYKLPYYEKGKWNFNFFRGVVDADIEKQVNIIDRDIKNIEDDSIEDNRIVERKDKTRFIYDDTNTLIHGKYFIVRFIFSNNKIFKLENVNVNINKY